MDQAVEGVEEVSPGDAPQQDAHGLQTGHILETPISRGRHSSHQRRASYSETTRPALGLALEARLGTRSFPWVGRTLAEKLPELPQAETISFDCRPSWQAAMALGVARRPCPAAHGGLGRGAGRRTVKRRTFQVPAPPTGDPGAPDRLEPGEVGEDDVASVMVPQIEQVAGQGGPQIDAGRPGQQGVLEAGSEVRVVGVHRQIGVLRSERTAQCCGSRLQSAPPTPEEGDGVRQVLPELWGQKAREADRAPVCTRAGAGGVRACLRGPVTCFLIFLPLRLRDN